MNKRTSILVDVLFVIAMLSAVMSFASFFAGDAHNQLYNAIWACFGLLVAVLLCVYPKGRA